MMSVLDPVSLGKLSRTKGVTQTHFIFIALDY
jgi:hypothetical protein